VILININLDMVDRLYYGKERYPVILLVSFLIKHKHIQSF